MMKPIRYSYLWVGLIVVAAIVVVYVALQHPVSPKEVERSEADLSDAEITRACRSKVFILDLFLRTVLDEARDAGMAEGAYPGGPEQDTLLAILRDRSDRGAAVGLLVCPASPHYRAMARYEDMTPEKLSYQTWTWSELCRSPQGPDMVLLWEKDARHAGKRHVVFWVEGIRLMTDDEFNKALSASREMLRE